MYNRYIVHTNEWVYVPSINGIIAQYVDNDMAFRVTIASEFDRHRNVTGIRLMGESLSCFDDNIYYYDLSHNELTAKAFVDTYMPACKCLDEDGRINTDIVLPDWFVKHMCNISVCKVN